MADTTFTSGTVVTSAWLNDINDHVYNGKSLDSISAINIKDPTYGAVGDGVADDTAAIQAALDSLTSGGTVYVPPGTYRITSDVILTNNNVTIVGVRGASIFQQVGNKVLLYIQSNYVDVSGIKFVGDQSAGSSARTNLVIIGGSGKTPTKITIHHNDFLESSSTCILYGGDLAACSDIYIHHNTMTDFWECGVDCVTSGQARVWITDNIMVSSVVHPNAAVSRPIGVGMEPQNAGSSTDIYVMNNYVDFSGISVPDRNVTHGFSVGQPSSPPANFTLRRITYSGNHVRGAGHGLRMQKLRWGTTTDSVTIKVADNTFESLRDNGIYLGGGDDATYTDTASVTGNIIKGFSEATTNLYDAIILANYWNRATIVGNTITARMGETGATNGRYGVNISSANISNTLIANNNIQNVTSGRYNDASTTTVINDLSNTTTVALTADNQEITVDNYTYISITSNDATAANRTFRLLKGKYAGQRVVLYWPGTNAGEYVDNSTASDSTVARLSATWTPTEFDSLQLVWDGSTSWIETARSAN